MARVFTYSFNIVRMDKHVLIRSKVPPGSKELMRMSDSKTSPGDLQSVRMFTSVLLRISEWSICGWWKIYSAFMICRSPQKQRIGKLG